MMTKMTYTIALRKSGGYYPTYKFTEYKRLANFRKAIKRIRFDYYFYELDDITLRHYTDGRKEYIVYLG